MRCPARPARPARLEPAGEDGVVEHASETVLVFEEALARDVVKRVVVRQHSTERQEGSRHADARIAEDSGERGEPAQREPWGCDEAVGVQDADQRDLDEEALGRNLGRKLVNGEGAMGELAGDDAGVVGSIPSARRRGVEELQPLLDARA